MVKTPKRANVPYRKKHRSRKKQPKVLPWALGAAALLVIILMVYNSLRKPGTDEPGPRNYESLFGVSGTSMNIGETNLLYPNPGNQESGQKLLPALGDPTAPVTIIEFSDIFCGYCRDFALNNLEGIVEDYVAQGKVRYVDHYFGFGNTLQVGALDAMMCAAEQGHYYEYKHTLFQAIEVDAFDLQRAARVSGLDMTVYKDCVASGRYKGAIQEMVYDDNMGVTGTPTFFINGDLVSGNRPEEIRQKIEQALGN